MLRALPDDLETSIGVNLGALENEKEGHPPLGEAGYLRYHEVSARRVFRTEHLAPGFFFRESALVVDGKPL